MVIKNELSVEEARANTKVLIAFLKKQPVELRTVLAKAKLTEAYLILGFKSFNAYLAHCIKKAGIEMKEDYARKQANAGIVEIHVLGEKNIGSMKEGALRILSENVDKVNWIKVYGRAKKFSKDEYPTSSQIIKAAKILKVYKQEKSKPNRPIRLKEKKIKTNNKPLLLNGAEGNGNKTFNTGVNNIPDVESDNKVSSSNPSNAKVVSIKSLTSDKASKHIINKYEANDIINILGFLRVSQDEMIKRRCNHILTNCNEGAIKNTIKKLSRHLQDCKSTPTKKGIKKAG